MPNKVWRDEPANRCFPLPRAWLSTSMKYLCEVMHGKELLINPHGADMLRWHERKPPPSLCSALRFTFSYLMQKASSQEHLTEPSVLQTERWCGVVEGFKASWFIHSCLQLCDVFGRSQDWDLKFPLPILTIFFKERLGTNDSLAPVPIINISKISPTTTSILFLHN